jgi:hypothetical protein
MKTLKQVEITPIFLDGYLPKNQDLEQNKIYISKEYNGLKHLCLCGCGETSYIPLAPNEWTLTEKNGKVSLTPSLLHRFACKSHYIITNNVANFV